MTEYLLLIYLAGAVVALCYEWNFGPYSSDYSDSAVPGWIAAVCWPITWVVRAVLYLGSLSKTPSVCGAVSFCEPSLNPVPPREPVE